MKVGDWLDERTGWRGIVRHTLNEPILGGARWAYIFGSALAGLFVVQAVTGVLLALYYSPSSREAWGSVHYVTHVVRLGWFVRGLHHFGSSAIIVLLIAHMVQVFVYGAYRRPREINWWSGVALLFVTLAFSLTGYLLPWDQKGYWATRVVSSIAGTMPWVGSWLRGTLQGGNDIGNLTLTRFFGFHVFALPAALVLLLVVHLVVFRKHGVTPRWSRTDLESQTEPFWPRQLGYDMVGVTLTVGIVALVTLLRHGATLEAPADPGSNYLARPEWYFRWLFELLKVIPGRWEGPGVLLFGVIVIAFFAALPLVDRAPSASPRARWRHFVVAFALAATVAGLTIHSEAADASDPAVRRLERVAEADASRASELAMLGIPPGGAEALYLNDPVERGRRTFASQCQSCHPAPSTERASGPDLTDYMSPRWVRGVIADPTRPDYFGRTTVSGMNATDATPAELDTLAQYSLSLGGRAPEPPGGAALFEDLGCQVCHARTGNEQHVGVSLAGYGSRAWILGVISHASSPTYYGSDSHMPSFDRALSSTDRDDLVTFLLSQRRPP